MPDRDDQRLARLFRNAERFFWGVFNMNQMEVYPYHEIEYGLKFEGGKYRVVEVQFLRDYGASAVLDIARGEVYDKLEDQLIQMLAERWSVAGPPHSTAELGKFSGISHFAGLLEVSPYQSRGELHRLIRCWGTFASIFFEELM
jgi:hypothetical protein